VKQLAFVLGFILLGLIVFWSDQNDLINAQEVNNDRAETFHSLCRQTHGIAMRSSDAHTWFCIPERTCP
jgi:hypothetical protein